MGKKWRLNGSGHADGPRRVRELRDGHGLLHLDAAHVLQLVDVDVRPEQGLALLGEGEVGGLLHPHVDEVAGDHEDRGEGHAPADHVAPPRVLVVLVLDRLPGGEAEDQHAL